MKSLVLLLFTLTLGASNLFAQDSTPVPVATETIQQSHSLESSVSTQDPAVKPATTLTIPAGTTLEVECAYTVSSLHVKPGELLSFRVLIPVTIGGVVVIDRDALVTARVTYAKRGGHWGKSGRLTWAMQDVVAVDNTRILLAPETTIRIPAWILDRPKNTNQTTRNESSIKGTSHKGEVATKTVIAAAIFPPLAPLALMHGFQRGEDAVLPEGKRFVVVTKNDSNVAAKQQ